MKIRTIILLGVSLFYAAMYAGTVNRTETITAGDHDVMFTIDDVYEFELWTQQDQKVTITPPKKHGWSPGSEAGSITIGECENSSPQQQLFIYNASVDQLAADAFDTSISGDILCSPGSGSGSGSSDFTYNLKTDLNIVFDPPELHLLVGQSVELKCYGEDSSYVLHEKTVEWQENTSGILEFRNPEDDSLLSSKEERTRSSILVKAIAEGDTAIEASESDDDMGGSYGDPVITKANIPYLKSVDYIGDDNQILRKQGDDTWENDNYGDDGEPINHPEWQSDEETLNEPVCYTMGATPKMNIVIFIPGEQLTENDNIKLRIKIGDDLIYENELNGDDALVVGDNEISGIDWDDIFALKQYVYKQEYSLLFELSFDGGNNYNTTLGTAENLFMVTKGVPITKNSYDKDNYLTCRRLWIAIENATPKSTGIALQDETLSSNIQKWRDNTNINKEGINVSNEGSEIWSLLDGNQNKGQCHEGALLMEQALKLLGVQNVSTVHVYASIGFNQDGDITVGTTETPAAFPFRNLHQGDGHGIEQLKMYYEFDPNIPPEQQHLRGWNAGEGCVEVGDTYYTTFIDGQMKGKAGENINGTFSRSPGHAILLKIEENTPKFQRWQKSNGLPCDHLTENFTPVPK